MPDDRLPLLFDEVPQGTGSAMNAAAEGFSAEVNPDGPVGFADGKAVEALRTIGEVATALGIRQHVLRYWEEQFPMLRPLKRSGARRYYRPADVALIERIDRLVHKDGYTLRGARLVLQGRGGEAMAERPAAQPLAPAPSVVPSNGMATRLRAIRLKLALAIS